METAPHTAPPSAHRENRRRRRTMAIAVAVAAIIAAALVVGLIWTGTRSAGPDALPEGAGADRTAAPSDAASAARGPAAGGTPVDGSEVLPPAAGTDPNRIPPRAADPPTVSAPLPAAGSASGHLVAGFPADVVGPAPGDDVIDSSLSPEGTTLQVTLTARSDRAPDEIRSYFRDLWAPYGMIAQTASTENQLFASDTASVTLDVIETGTGTVYSLFATLRTE